MAAVAATPVNINAWVSAVRGRQLHWSAAPGQGDQLDFDITMAPA
jgi:hypothetical protein